MEPNFLLADELDYELRIRGAVVRGGVDIKRSILRGHLQCEKVKEVNYPPIEMDFQEEIMVCQNKMGTLEDMINFFYSDKRHPDYRRIKARLMHLKNRIDRLIITTIAQSNVKVELATRVVLLVDKLETKVSGYEPPCTSTSKPKEPNADVNLISLCDEDEGSGSEESPLRTGNAFSKTISSRNPRRVSFVEQFAAESTNLLDSRDMGQANCNTPSLVCSPIDTRQPVSSHVAAVDHVSGRVVDSRPLMVSSTLSAPHMPNQNDYININATYARHEDDLCYRGPSQDDNHAKLSGCLGMDYIPRFSRFPGDMFDDHMPQHTQQNQRIHHLRDGNSMPNNVFEKNQFLNPNSKNSQSFLPTFYHQQTTNQNIIQISRSNLKYSGRNQSLHGFLEKVEEFCLARNISKSSLLNFAHELFEGEALIWFRSHRDNIISWNDLINKLRLDFLPCDYEADLWDEVRARTQGNNERSLIYIAVMENLFQRFVHPVEESVKLRLIIRNLQPYFQGQLALSMPRTLLELKNLCRILEDVKTRTSRFHEPPPFSSNTLEPELAYRRFSNTKTKANINEISQFITETDSETDNQCRNREVTAMNNATVFKAAMCWNCGDPNHVFRRCTKPRTLFCYGCGKKNVTRPKCPTCNSKNANVAGLMSAGPALDLLQ